MDSELKWQEVNWNRSLSILADLNVLVLAVERIRSSISVLGLVASLGSIFGHVTSTLSSTFSSGSALCWSSFSASASLNLVSCKLLGATSAFVKNLDLEKNIGRETVLNHQVDLLRFVKLGRLGQDFH